MLRDAALTRRQLFPAFAAGALSARAAAAEPRPIVLRASDGVNVYAWHYPAVDSSLPAILLFHQAGSNHAEYATIAPRLAALGRLARRGSLTSQPGDRGTVTAEYQIGPQ